MQNKIAQSNLETGRVATLGGRSTLYPPRTGHALSHSYAANSSLFTIRRPTFAPKITLSREPIPKPN